MRAEMVIFIHLSIIPTAKVGFLPFLRIQATMEELVTAGLLLFLIIIPIHVLPHITKNKETTITIDFRIGRGHHRHLVDEIPYTPLDILL